MARYYRHNPVEYESMFVPLPLDLFAAKMQQSQQGYDQMGLMKSQFEDEFRKVNRLDPDVVKTNERLNTYVEDFNSLIDESKGDVNAMASGLKNLHRKFQEDMQYGHLGAIQQSYAVYNDLQDKYSKALEEGKSTEAQKYRRLMREYDKWGKAGGTNPMKDAQGRYTIFGATGPVKPWDKHDWESSIQSNWKEDLTTQMGGDQYYKWLQSVGGISRDEATKAVMSSLSTERGFQEDLEDEYAYTHRDLDNLPDSERVGLMAKQVGQKLQNRITQTEALINSAEFKKYSASDQELIKGHLSDDKQQFADLSGMVSDNPQMVESMYKQDWKNERVQEIALPSIEKITHRTLKQSDLIMGVEGYKAVEDYKIAANQKLGEEIVLNSEAGAPEDASGLWKQAIADAEAGGDSGRSNAIRTLDAIGGLFTGPITYMKAFTSGKNINEYLLEATTAIVNAKTPEEAAIAMEKFTGTRPANMTSDDLKNAKEALIPSINGIRNDTIMDENIDILIDKTFNNKWGDLDYSKLNASGDYTLQGIANRRMSFANALNGGTINKETMSMMLGDMDNFLSNNPEYKPYFETSPGKGGWRGGGPGGTITIKPMPDALRQKLYAMGEHNASVAVNAAVKNNPKALYNSSKEAQSYVFHDYTAADGGVAELNNGLNLAFGGKSADEIAGTVDSKGTEFAQLDGGLDEWVATDKDAKYSDHALYGPGWASVTFVRKDDPNVKKTIHINTSKVSPNVTSVATGNLVKDAVSYNRAINSNVYSNAADLNTANSQLKLRYTQIGSNIIGALRPMTTDGDVQTFTIPTNTGGAIPMLIKASKNRYTNDMQYDVYGMDDNGDYTVPIPPADGSVTHGDLNAVRASAGEYYTLPQSGNVNPNYKGNLQSVPKAVQEAQQYFKQKGIQ